MEELYEVKEGLSVSTSEFWYDLTDGGYLNPEDILTNPEDVEEVKRAIAIVKKFERSCDEQIEGFIQ